MQLIPCPFCGPRSESEFHFGGDVGNVRPEGGADIAGRATPKDGHLAIGQNPPHARDGLRESLQRGRFIGGMDQSRRDVPPVRAVDLDHSILMLIKFKQPPFRRCPVQVRHALPHQRGTTVGHE